MATAFQADAFQADVLAWQIGGAAPEPPPIIPEIQEPTTMGRFNMPFSLGPVRISLEKLGLRTVDDEDDEFILLM